MNKLVYLLCGFIISIATLYRCQPKNADTKDSNAMQDTTSLSNEEIKALYLLDKQCFSCHHPTSSNMPAPSLLLVRDQYIEDNGSESKFVSAMTNFLKNPSEQTSHMPDAIKKYGLMPKQDYDTSDIRAIATFLFKFTIKPDAWDAYWEKNKPIVQTYSTNRPMIAKGKEMAVAAKGELGKNLMSAIQQRGTENAVELCNLKALPITDSLSKVVKATLRRVSDKPRNPKNAANAEEIKIIENFKKSLTEKKLKPFSKEDETTFTGYYPIETNKMCMQCHGTQNTDIQPAVLAKINKLYPHDKATGYGENQIRGMWVVQMPKTKK